MRILAIRGCLASLACELGIDLASGVLGGPAGAGKITLAERGARS